MMIEIGKFNQLKVTKHIEQAVYLDGGDAGEILLQLTDSDSKIATNIGEILDVFIYVVSKDELRATLKKPHAQVDEVAWLSVISVSSVGAFLDWGLEKDLFLPFSEQIEKVIIGQFCLVKLFLDETNRIAASMLLNDFIQENSIYFKVDQKVDLIIADETELGTKAIVNHQFWGVLYKNEIFQKLSKGQKITGYIKKVREDHKIDLTLQIAKYADKVDSVTEKILAQLAAEGGVMTITDKSPPDVIYNAFGVSKKVFKQSIGTLYKKRLITFDNNSIRLVDKK